MSTSGLLAGRRTARRDLRVDAVRGAALVSMYVAHTAPSAGPGHLLTLSEYATFPLFALLVGVGADLGARTVRRWWIGPLVRGLVLVVAAQLLETLGAQVLIVLAQLGVLTWVTAPLARARSEVVAAVTLACLAISPQLDESSTGWTATTFPGGDDALPFARFLLAGWPYQIVAMAFFAGVGILVARHLLPSGRGGHLRRLALGAVLGAVALAWIGLHQSGAFDMAAYDLTYRVLTFDAVLIVAVTLVVAGLAGMAPTAAAPLASMGGMSLTLYCLQVAWLAFYARVLHPGLHDDSWTNLGLLVAGSAVVAVGWRALVRIEPWRRGPLEGPVAAVVANLSRAGAHV